MHDILQYISNFFMFVLISADVWSSHFLASGFPIFISITKIHALVPRLFPGFALTLHSKITSKLNNAGILRTIFLIWPTTMHSIKADIFYSEANK